MNLFFSDLKFIILWWSIYFIVGTLAIPLILNLFKNFWDKGYIYSKTIGTLFITYVIYVLGIFKIIPFTSVSLFCLMVFFFGLDILYLNQNNNLLEFKKTIRSHWKIFLLEEIIFLTILTSWSFVRGFAPDIEGLEKFMDWGFVNSALRGQFMPPLDMWFSGFPINYYYFGHLVAAVLTKLSNIDSAITYNLSIASVCALTFTSGFSLASNLIQTLSKKINYKNIIIGGLFSAILLTFGGNLHPLYKISQNIIKDNGKLVLTKDTITKAASSYWYPDATRFIGFDPDVKDKTIHEFPIYSFVVADLHGHMNDIPLVILFLAILFSVYSINSKSVLNWKLILILSLCLSIAFMTNAWDFAVYGLVFAVFSFFSRSFKYTVIHGILIIIFWYIFTLPFLLNFTSMAEGLRLSDMHSPFYQLFVLYGGFWLISLPFVLYLILTKFKKTSPADIFVFSLIVVATILIIIPEIGYIKDIYIFEHRRANTMFKLVYQAFILYSLISGYLLIKFRQNIFYKLLFILVFVSHLIFPFFAIKSYYGLTSYKGLWGLNFLKTTYPDNYEAINWLNKNISGQPVILEAVGDSYTTFNQVSIATGLPTVEGWIVHEWLWRGGYDKPSVRQADVQKIYESTDSSEVKTLLQKYSVQYIFVGDKEREKYPALNEKTFTDLGFKIVFESGLTKVYKLN